MKTSLFMVFVLFLSLPLFAEDEVRRNFFTFPVDDWYQVRIELGRTQSYQGRELYFVDQNGRKLCLNQNAQGQTYCAKNFFGTIRPVSIVLDSVQPLPPTLRLKSRRTVVAQTHGLPSFPPQTSTSLLLHRQVSYIEMWGYDRRSIPKEERKEVEATFSLAKRTYRQELFLGEGDDIAPDEKPFAIIEWEHGPNEIRITRVQRVERTNLAAASNP